MTNPSVDDIPYRTIGGADLLGRLYRPNTTGPAPYVIDVHGGAWRNGDRLNNEIIHVDFAANGIGVFALDFRLSTEAQYPAPVDDVNYGIRWFNPQFSQPPRSASCPGDRPARRGPKSVAEATVEANDVAGGRLGATRRAALSRRQGV